MMEDIMLKHSEECKDPPQLFTYYQGDINTAVDEHFFRALNKATTPKDLSTKAKDSNRIPKSDVPSSSWASGVTWSKSTHSSSSKLAQLTTMGPPSQGVIVNPSVLSSSSSSSPSSTLWPCPPRQSTAYELPQILYQQPMAAESSASSYLNLLQMDRPTGGIMISPFSKSETRPEWNSGTAFRDGSRIGMDSGVPVSEISKDLYWY
ncbi:uncharacterized protein LOC127966757 [Carassius gibelio]|uniref:uncharacterized protein LOC127966757 n=1 Tax=Carassius gibelio TaxID=101364 RepID=UPI0022791205|nr:uncharacterized protein LOC127966757 [Carassius gibelio]XP_052423932.1 uncharacterized protein LOC127966757 [Carassius gibelio]